MRPFIIAILVLANVLLFYPITGMADVVWQQLGGSMNVSSLAIDSTNSRIMYAGTTSSGMYKTIDGGSTWNAINTGITKGIFFYDPMKALVIDPANHQIVYAGTAYNTMIYKSTDSGVSWVAVTNGLPSYSAVSVLAIDPTNSQIVYAGTNSGTYKSTTGGGAWSPVDSSGTIISLALDPTDSRTVYAGLDNFQGIRKTSDAGATWKTVTTSLISLSATALAIDPTNHLIVYAVGPSGITAYRSAFKSTDGGVTWSYLVNGPSSSSYNSLVIDPANSETVYLGTSGSGVAGTVDGGVSWTAANSGLTSLTVNTLAIDPTASQIIYAGTQGGVWKGESPPSTSYQLSIDTVGCRGVIADFGTISWRGLNGAATYRDGNLVTLTNSVATCPDFTFNGWTGVCTGTGPCQVKMDAAKSVTATFVINAVCGSDNGKALATTPTNLCAPGTPASLAGTGPWTWTCQGSYGGSNANCAAKLRVPVTIQTNPTGLSINIDGAAATSPKNIDWVWGDNHTIATTVVQNGGTGTQYRFANWSDSGAISHSVATPLTPTTYTANFTTEYQLTVAKAGTGSGIVTSEPAGINCGSSCQTGFSPGQSVTLTAQPVANTVFAGWSGACSGLSPTCTLTVDAPKNATSRFDLQYYKLTITKSGTGGGQLSSVPLGLTCTATLCSGAFLQATPVTITADADPVSVFKQWSGACTGTGTCQLVLSADATAQSIFDQEMTMVWDKDKVLEQRGDYPFAGIYLFDNLTIADNIQITSKGVSQIVIKVNNTLSVGKNASIRVRNGYYPLAPANSPADVTADTMSTKGKAVDDFYLFANIFGKGGNSGQGGDGSNGSATFVGTGYTGYYWICGDGGGGGGSGGGGYGGGVTGSGGVPGAGGHFDSDNGCLGFSGSSGKSGASNGGYGGDGAADPASGGMGGLGNEIGYPGKNNYSTMFGSGGGGGGGNGGSGHSGTGGNALKGASGGGGGGGGYGGGILTILAGTINLSDNTQHFLVSGQIGGSGSSGGVAGASGQGGLLIINSKNYTGSVNHWNLDSATYGVNTVQSTNGGHGMITGDPQKVITLSDFSPGVYLISGNAGVADATITLSGTASRTASSNSSGAYSFSYLNTGSYTITPAKLGFSFSPVSRTITVSNQDIVAPGFTVADIALPTITTFVLPTMATDLTVPFTLIATDNAGIASFYLSESDATPAIDNLGWSTTLPSSFTFAARGLRILYAWVKDAAGNLSTRSSATVVIKFKLNVTINGSGGNVNSDPAGINCTSGTCETTYAPATLVKLLELPGSLSLFTAWGGDCSGNGAYCDLTMESDKAVTANFSDADRARIGATGYSTLNAAYSAAPTGSIITIMTLDALLTESLTVNKQLVIVGGYNATYTERTGQSTVLQGTMTIGTGKLTVDGLIVR